MGGDLRHTRCLPDLFDGQTTGGERAALHDLLIALEVTDALAHRLADYGQRVLQANRKFNLTGARSPAELVKHLMDALFLVPYVADPLVDVGSGAGFPAIPLALATGVELLLIEASGKKAAFLCDTLEHLALRGRVLAQRSEVAAHQAAWREQYASATARGVSSGPAVVELTLPFLRIGGRAVLQRGDSTRQERAAVADAALMLGGRLEETVRAFADRDLYLIAKEHPTPGRFPRRPGIPHKRPLCFAAPGAPVSRETL